MLEGLLGSRSRLHAAPGDCVRSPRYCCRTDLRFSGPARDRPHVSSLCIALSLAKPESDACLTVRVAERLTGQSPAVVPAGLICRMTAARA
jgi:hypothetical protein